MNQQGIARFFLSDNQQKNHFYAYSYPKVVVKIGV